LLALSVEGISSSSLHMMATSPVAEEKPDKYEYLDHTADVQ